VSGNGALTKSGAGALTLSGANTFVGTTTVQTGTLTASGAAAKLGAGNVVVTGGTVTIGSGVSDAIANTATLSLAGGGAARASLGTGVNERVAALLLNGVAQLSGRTYGSTSASGAMVQDNAYFSGNGILTVGLLGDFNGNNTVDAADYLIWRKSYSSNSAMYTAWRANFGQSSSGSGAGGSLLENVPEPASGCLLLAGMLALSLRRVRVPWPQL
jgi:autotransporter-associated beta strand protein